MKNLLQLLFTALLCSCISLKSCTLSDNDPKPKTELEKLPPATQEGKNTFGCLVDGKAWVIEVSTHAPSYYQVGVLSITAFLNNNYFDQGISIIILEANLTETEYILTEYPQIFGRLRDYNSNCEYLTSTLYTGRLIITHFDQTNFIISGTFEFEGYSANCSKVIKITNGRFDLNYAP